MAKNKPLFLSRRFAPLFWCQFFSAFGDNYLKNALVFLILFRIGGSAGEALITLAAAIFIAPYFFLSALGGEIEVPTLTGPAKLKIPPGTQSGTIFRLRGQGLPNVHGDGHGDQHVRIIVEVPARLTREMRQKLEEFARLANESAYPQYARWLEKAKRFFTK